jgi:hypothetical protein
LIATAAAILVSLAAPPAQAAGLVHCVNQTHRGACYEPIWVDGRQVRMVFPQAGNDRPGNRGTDAMSFYVTAPQTDDPQGSLPFPHDHVVPAAPGEPGYSVLLHGYLVVCSPEGLSSGACVANVVEYPGFGPLPLAESVNGQALTSAEPIESAVDEGLVVLLDPGASSSGPSTRGGSRPRRVAGRACRVPPR